MGPQVTEDLVKACNTIIEEHGAPHPTPPTPPRKASMSRRAWGRVMHVRR